MAILDIVSRWRSLIKLLDTKIWRSSGQVYLEKKSRCSGQASNPFFKVQLFEDNRSHLEMTQTSWNNNTSKVSFVYNFKLFLIIAT